MCGLLPFPSGRGVAAARGRRRAAAAAARDRFRCVGGSALPGGVQWHRIFDGILAAVHAAWCIARLLFRAHHSTLAHVFVLA